MLIFVFWESLKSSIVEQNVKEKLHFGTNECTWAVNVKSKFFTFRHKNISNSFSSTK